MKSTSKILVAIFVLLSFSSCNAQIKNQKTATVTIYGNCGMCKETIEKAGNQKHISNVVWDKNSKTAELNFDSTKTSKAEILKKIALAGYDSEEFLAPNSTYNNLHSCCQYQRPEKKIMEITSIKTERKDSVSTIDISNGENKLDAVLNAYFELKDAFIQTDAAKCSVKAKNFKNTLESIQMSQLSHAEHLVWMEIKDNLLQSVKQIEINKDIEKQRTQFIDLSDNILKLLKVSAYKETVYLQFCPMANNGKGANWLSKEAQIKNPYFGTSMLSCGSTKETIK